MEFVPFRCATTNGIAKMATSKSRQNKPRRTCVLIAWLVCAFTPFPAPVGKHPVLKTPQRCQDKFVADAHRDDERHFVVRADEKLTRFSNFALLIAFGSQDHRRPNANTENQINAALILAGNGNRTRMASLEGWNFTIKLCPHRDSE